MFKKLFLIIFLKSLVGLSRSVPVNDFSVFHEYGTEKHEFKNTQSILIIGGDEVKIEDYPYQAAVHMFNHHYCGGAIISDRAVLTAAHCISPIHESILSVRVGSAKTHSGGTVIGVKSRIVHPDFNKSPADFDIGILILEDKLNFSKTVQPIELQISSPVRGELAFVSGWGRTETNHTTENLRAAEVRIANQDECFRNYTEVGYTMTERMLCAGLQDGGHDACQGDSGGPLLCKFSHQLCGISSFGKGCALKNYPGIYTKISNLREWILQWL